VDQILKEIASQKAYQPFIDALESFFEWARPKIMSIFFSAFQTFFLVIVK
jgi:hypothetical protein